MISKRSSLAKCWSPRGSRRIETRQHPERSRQGITESRYLESSSRPAVASYRLILENAIFGNNLSFVGLGGEPDNRRIITRQNIVEGRTARWQEIISFMVKEFTKR